MDGIFHRLIMKLFSFLKKLFTLLPEMIFWAKIVMFLLQEHLLPGKFLLYAI